MEVQGALGAGPGDGQAVQSVPGAGSPTRAPAPPLPSELGLHLGRGQSHGHGSGEGDSGLQQAPEGGPAARTPCRPGRTGLGEGRGGEERGHRRAEGSARGAARGAPALRRRTRAGQTGRASGRVWPVPAPQQGAALREHGLRVPRPPHSHHPLPRGPPGQRLCILRDLRAQKGTEQEPGAQGRGTFLATLLDVRPRTPTADAGWAQGTWDSREEHLGCWAGWPLSSECVKRRVGQARAPQSGKGHRSSGTRCSGELRDRARPEGAHCRACPSRSETQAAGCGARG